VTHRYFVFSDVDETLIRPKSMLAFMDHFLEHAAFATRPEATAVRQGYAALRAAHRAGADRALLNRCYYELFRGVVPSDVQQAAGDWVREVADKGQLFIATTCAELVAHKRLGARVVLVSGSFRELLEPICTRMPVDELLCTELELSERAYTGAIRQPIIGEGKWSVISAYLDEHSDVDLSQCYAYGDHISDGCFMEKMGHAVVVGDAPEMLELARQRSWRILPRDA
jgi:HAD superfamily hydrolase (TIGR01490 family)